METAKPPTPQPEVWLRGPLPDIVSLLQHVAHALLQVREDVDAIVEDLPSALLWERPSGAASPGFHLQHLSGVIDRLFTYARAESLSEDQLRDLENEGVPPTAGTTSAGLRQDLEERVETALAQLRLTPERILREERKVGRQGLPSTVLVLLVHAAEHTERHVGQLLVTVKILRER